MAPAPESIVLSESEVNALPYILTSKDIHITTNTRTKKRLFVQRFDAFTIDLVSLLHEMKDGELREISFRNALLGDFIVSRTSKGRLQGQFTPINPQAVNEFQSRLTKWRGQ